jgi:hypothetical protein
MTTLMDRAFNSETKLCRFVIPGREKREPGISRLRREIPGLVLRTIPE